jgi:poly(3-hydroxybutyrate) depolymerase
MQVKHALLALSLVVPLCVADETKLNLQLEHVSVSGLSSGGYMANQFHIAYSDWVNKVGIIAAGPYYCAQGSIKTALEQCVNKVLSPIPLKDLQDTVSRYAQEGKIAPLSNLKSSKVWLFHGVKDTTVVAEVSDGLYQQYVNWSGSDNVSYVKDKNFPHLFPTLSAGTECSESVSPFIGNCNYDAAGKMFSFLFDELQARTPATTGKLIELDQQQLGGETASTLADTGYAYVPASCAQGEVCSLHISFHGCNQNAQNVGTQYTEQTGINNWADSNHMVVFYPQTKNSTFMPLNPQGCWDWWGYADADYATQQGQQISAVRTIALALKQFPLN